MNRLKKSVSEETVNEIHDAVKNILINDDENEFVCKYKLSPEVFL